MISIFRAAIVVAGLLSVAAAPAVLANDPAPPPSPLSVPVIIDEVQFVQNVYERKQAIDTLGEGEFEANSVLIGETFSTELLAIMNAFYATPEPVLDGDVFWGAQDWEITDISFALTSTGANEGGQSVVTVSFKNFGEPRLAIITLIKQVGVWKIDNVGWEDGYDLRRMFREDVEGAAPATPTVP